MEREYLQDFDHVNGKEGTATAVINGNIEPLFYAKKIEVKAEIEKEEIKSLGSRVTGSKPVGVKYTGTTTIADVTSVFVDMVKEYEKTGILPTFNLNVDNDDPASSAGTKKTTCYGCTIDGATLAQLDTGSNSLEQEVAFTFNGFEQPKKYNKFGGAKVGGNA